MLYHLSQEVLADLNKPETLKRLQEQYKNAQPFPHIVLDHLFDPIMLMNVVEHFPKPGDTHWWQYENILEKKLAKNDLSELHPCIRLLVNELMENRMVSFLERLTGIEGLIVDHTLNGGGLHQIIRGGKLDIHADYNTHPVTGLDRRLNVLLYFNPDWPTAIFGGELELWDKDMSKCVQRIEPYFNRMVIFSTTDTAYHGHPDPLNCLDGTSRKSLALYFYSNGRPEHERSAPHSTLYQRRPWDPIVEGHEELRRQRAIRRMSQT